VPVEKDGQPPKEVKIGTFKLSGLKDVRVEDRHFEMSEIFEPAAEKYEGTTLLAVEG